MRKPPPVLGIFLTVLIDLLGFGLFIPDIQLRGDALGADGVVRGLLIASFSIAQLLTAPYLGRLSDRVGRRPVLLITTALSIAAYLFYGHATLLWIMFVARILQGIAGANLGVAYAYIADVTDPKSRAKSFGLIGMAFGIGFIFGPVIGAQLIHLGGGQPLILGYVASALAAVNFFYILYFLPESRKAGSHLGESVSRSHLANLGLAFRTPALTLLLFLFFAYNFAFSNLESTYFLLSVHEFGLTQREGSYVLAFVGVIAAIMQGGVIRVVTPIFGEVNLVRVAFFLQIPALAMIPFMHPWLPQLFAALLLGIGSGLAQPSIASLISRNSPQDVQGGTFGVTQSLGAFARILGPLASNPLFDYRHWAPYALAAGVMLIPGTLAWFLRMPQEQPEPA